MTPFQRIKKAAESFDDTPLCTHADRVATIRTTHGDQDVCADCWRAALARARRIAGRLTREERFAALREAAIS